MSRMNPWRLEWLRLTRSPRALALGLVYLCFGLLAPLLAKYLPDLVKHSASGGMTIIMPPPKPADGIANYVNQAAQTGILVLMIVAASTLSFDSRRGSALFYRTRVRSSFALIWPRAVLTTAAAVVSYALGSAAAWYGTWVVLGDLPARRVLPGVACHAVFLAFSVALVAAAATFGRNTLGTVGISAVVLFVALPLVSMVDSVAAWIPTTLLDAPAGLATGGGLAGPLRAVAVSAAAVPALLALATYRADRREI